MLYTKYNGNEVFITIPNQIDGDPITGIGPKAFLSCKNVRGLTLPNTITHIDDWAFAHMHNLTELTLPANDIRFGKKVFLGCDNLSQIHLLNETSNNPGLSRFLATAAIVFSQTALFDPVRAAQSHTHQGWMKDYDQQLIHFLLEDDLHGFEPVFYGWFNDEDADVSQKPAYLLKQRKTKTDLCFSRLKYDLYLSDQDRHILYNYLKNHMPWSEKAPEHTVVWDLLPEYCSNDIRILHILESAGILTPDTVPQLIRHLDGCNAEAIAYLLRYQESHKDFSGFFESFTL